MEQMIYPAGCPSVVSAELVVKEYLCYAARMDRRGTIVTPPSRIQWLTDLVRLEIALWERVDTRLRDADDLPLAFFEPLFFIAHSRDGSLRVGELARALHITVGGASKLVDRIDTAGLIHREPVANDRRACRVILTNAGKRKLADAGKTYEAELAAALNAVLDQQEQRLMHDLVRRLLAATHQGESS